MTEREKFEKYWTDTLGLRIDFDPILKELFWGTWQAALSTRKPYGYGIVNKNGPAFGVILTESGANHHLRAYKEAGKTGYRVVELFYEDQS